MTEPAKRRASYEEILNLPEHLVGEILGGKLYTHPRPAPKHARASSAIGGMLGDHYDWGRGPGGWWILDEPELHLGGDILVPDLAGWRRERLPTLPETAGFELPPDWICEVLSPTTARLDRAVKMPIYARYGVPHLWLIDPDLKTLEVYAIHHTQSTPHWLLLATLEGEASVRQPPFDAIEFSLATLWV
ncbi:MAG: Uma2 family endonuclease [Methylohalobius sp.]|nr:Uma2 family endonuclease [Methylohalobius sp.]